MRAVALTCILSYGSARMNIRMNLCVGTSPPSPPVASISGSFLFQRMELYTNGLIPTIPNNAEALRAVSVVQLGPHRKNSWCKSVLWVQQDCTDPDMRI